MPAYYVETGALIKRYKPEPGSEVVSELLERRQPADILVTSHLTVLEVIAVAARLLKGRVIRRSHYDRLVARLAADLDDFHFQVVPLHSQYVQDAMKLYPRDALRAADALHFVTALSVRDAVGDENFVLVSGDSDIVDAAIAAQVRVIDPEHSAALDQLREARRS